MNRERRCVRAETRSHMQALRSFPAPLASRVSRSPQCPQRLRPASQSPLARIAPFGGGDPGRLLERLRERRGSRPTKPRRHICDRISACEQGFRTLDSACFGVSPDALPRLARERRAQVRTAHEQHARKLVQAGRASLVEHALDGCLRLKGKSGPLMRRSTATCGIVAGARCGQCGHHLLDARLDKQCRTRAVLRPGPQQRRHDDARLRLVPRAPEPLEHARERARPAPIELLEILWQKADAPRRI